MSKPSAWHTLVGLGFGVAGASKLLAVRPQAELFESWGWPKQSMQVIGAAELVGALLLVTGRTQKVGAALLTTTSGCVLQHEIAHGDDELVTPRAAMLLAAASGFLGGGRAHAATPEAPSAPVPTPKPATPSAPYRAPAPGPSKVRQVVGALAAGSASVAGRAGCAAGKAAMGVTSLAARKAGGLAAGVAKQAGAAAADLAGRAASSAGQAAGRQARVLGRKAARQASRAGDVAADYARQAAAQASDRAKEMARSKGWA